MRDTKTLVDPEGRYPSEDPRVFEEIAVFVLRWREPHILARTRDAIEIRFPSASDDDWELVALITPDYLELRLPTIEWTTGYGGPALTSEFWKRTPVDRLTENDVHGWLRKLETSMKRRLRRCRYCEERFVAARMTGRACNGCASTHENVLY